MLTDSSLHLSRVETDRRGDTESGRGFICCNSMPVQFVQLIDVLARFTGRQRLTFSRLGQVDRKRSIDGRDDDCRRRSNGS